MAQPQGRGAAADAVRRTQRAALPHAGGEQGGNTPPSRAAPAGHNHCAAPAGHRHRTNQGGSVRREGQQTEGGRLQDKGARSADRGGIVNRPRGHRQQTEGASSSDRGGHRQQTEGGAIFWGYFWGNIGGYFGGVTPLYPLFCRRHKHPPHPSPVLRAALSLHHCDTIRGRVVKQTTKRPCEFMQR